MCVIFAPCSSQPLWWKWSGVEAQPRHLWRSCSALLCCNSGARRWAYLTLAVLAAAHCHRTMDGLSSERKKLFPSSVPGRPGGSERTGRHVNRLCFSPSSRFIGANVSTNGLWRLMWNVFFWDKHVSHSFFTGGVTTCQKAAHWHVFGSQNQRCATRRQIRQLPPDKLTSRNGDGPGRIQWKCHRPPRSYLRFQYEEQPSCLLQPLDMRDQVSQKKQIRRQELLGDLTTSALNRI